MIKSKDDQYLVLVTMKIINVNTVNNLEYSAILFAHSDEKMLNKIQAVETQAIKIAFRLTP